MKIKYFLSLFFLLPGCTLFLTKPEVKLDKVEVSNVSEKSIDMQMVLEIKNPNSRDISVEKLNYIIQVNNSNPFKQELSPDFQIDGNSTKQIKLPVSIPTSELIGVVFDYLVKKQLTYSIFGAAKVNGMEVGFKKNGELPR